MSVVTPVPAQALPTLVMHSLLDAGSKSVSHFDRLVEKFGRTLRVEARSELATGLERVDAQ
jgi:hypothetical protein